jgi:transcriptional regulator with XRE-family HTH domain
MPSLRGSDSANGSRLRALRLDLRLSVRQVELQSEVYAERRNDRRFRLSHSWLSRLETQDLVPNIFAIESLSAIYGIPAEHLLALYSPIPAASLDADLHDSRALGRKDVNVRLLRPNGDGHLILKAVLSKDFDLRATWLVTSLSDLFTVVPAALEEFMKGAAPPFGYVGLDNGMMPLIEAGDVVSLDTRKVRIPAAKDMGLLACPLYFLQLRSRDLCGWCEVVNGRIMVRSGPLSSQSVQSFAFREVDIVGQITAVLLKLRTARGGSPDLNSADFIQKTN